MQVNKIVLFTTVLILVFGLGFVIRELPFFTSTKKLLVDREVDSVQTFVNPPEAKKANPTSKPTPTPTSTSDPDPIVNCDISPKCGLPKMKRSACRQLTCCQVGDKFILLALINGSGCPENQKTPTTQQKTDECNIVTIACGAPSHFDTASGCSLSEAQTTCERYKNRFGNFDTCMSDYRTAYENCKAPCDSSKNEGDAICRWAYGESAGVVFDPTKYGECIDEVRSIWSKCQDSCQYTYTNATATCIQN